MMGDVSIAERAGEEVWVMVKGKHFWNPLMHEHVLVKSIDEHLMTKWVYFVHAACIREKCGMCNMILFE